MSTIQEKVFLQQHAARVQGALDSSKAMVEFSKMLLRGTLILNGAAIIPIVYSKVTLLYPSAITFGVGALLSVIATGAAYFTQNFVYNTWTPDLFGNLQVENKLNSNTGKYSMLLSWNMDINKAAKYSIVFKCITGVLLMGSFGVFICGLWQAYEQVGTLQAVWL